MLNHREKGPSDTPDATKPSLREVAPRYGELHDRWTELVAREDELTARLRPIVARVAKAGGYNTAATMPTPPKPSRPADYKPGIAKLIGDVIPFRKPEPPAANEIGLLRAQAVEISDELAEIADAKTLLWPELRKATFAGSAELIEALKPEYDAIARRIVDALLALGGALADQQAFVREIEAQGATTQTLRRIALDFDGSDPFARIAIALRQAVQHGYVDAAAIPAEIIGR